MCRPALRDNRSGNLSGSCRQGEGTPDNVEHVKRPNSISWKRDTQQDAPRPRGAPCPSCFHPCVLSRSGKSWSRRTPWDIFLSACLFKRATSFRVRRRDSIKCGLIKLIAALVVSHDELLLSKTSGLNLSRFYNRCVDSLIVNFLRSIFTHRAELVSIIKNGFCTQIFGETFQGNFWRRFWNILFSGTMNFFKWKIWNRI